MLELIVVVAIIAILVGSILGGSSGRREKISEAKSTASDFYAALQTEFLNFQMFDGPLTMTLKNVYNAGITSIGKNTPNGGIKYYPAVGGNYPFDGTVAVGETHEDGKPKGAVLYVEFYTYAGTLRRVNYANDMVTLTGMVGTGNQTAELCQVLKEEMKERMQYKDGYYYARISYTPPTGVALSKFDYRAVAVKVDWTAYSTHQVTADELTFRFKSQNMLRSGRVCGVHTTKGFESVGTTGTSLRDY